MSALWSQLVSWSVSSVKVLGGLASVVVVLLYVYQNNLLYMPNPPGFPKTPAENPKGSRNPGEWKSEKGEPIPFEETFLKTKDGKNIHVWLMLRKDSENRPTLIYFHGNAGNMGFRLKNAAKMYSVSQLNVLMMDYRGYGSSDGEPTETGLNLDADAVLDYATKHPRLSGSPIIAFGRSLGGAVSVSLASRHPESVKALVLENTFLSIADMVDKLMPYVSALKWIVLNNFWDSAKKIQSLKQHILFISGDKDELVPAFHMKKLYDVACSSTSKDFYLVKGGTHNDTWERAGAAYYTKLKEFSDKLVGDADNSLSSSCSTIAEDDDFELVDGETLEEVKSSLPTMQKNFKVL